MPTYQYACTSCGERLGGGQKLSDDPLTECPACHGTLRKVFSPVGVVFKGSGFYKTDSRKSPTSTKPAKDSSSGDGAKKDESSSSSSGSSDSSKSAPKTDGAGSSSGTGSTSSGSSASSGSPASSGSSGQVA